VSFGIQEGEFVLLLGSNGAGKSSLIKTIVGEHSVYEGDLRVGSVALIAQDPRASTYDALTVGENCRLRCQGDCREHLSRFLPRLADLSDLPVGCLSGGERQVLALALCLLDPPDLLLLDEHTSALDPKTAEHVMTLTVDIVRDFSVATLMTTHNLDHAEKYGARVLGLRGGKLCFDGRAKSREELLQLCYD
jgi:putative ABC transport system ATP-binding protein